MPKDVESSSSQYLINSYDYEPSSAVVLSEYKTQTITFEDEEELTAEVEGRVTSGFRMGLLVLSSIATCGLVYLLTRWFSNLKKLFTTIPSNFERSTHVFIRNSFGEKALIPIQSVFLGEQETSGNNEMVKYFDYRCFRYIYSEGMFKESNYIPSGTQLNNPKTGLSDEESFRKRKILGNNEIVIEAQSTLSLLVNQILHPFTIFQVFSAVLWSMNSQYQYAAAIVVLSVFSATMTLVQTKKNLEALQKMVKFSSMIRILRGNEFVTTDSRYLAEGDVFEVCINEQFPCDAVLLEGDAIIDESMLTGESIPVVKTAPNDARALLSSPHFDSKSLKQGKYVVYAGTKIIRAKSSAANKSSLPLAVVVKTGFSSLKGSLIRSILHPKPNKFKFYEDSFKFMGILSGIAAVGVVLSIVKLSLLGFSVAQITKMTLDLITVVLPPALPATMSIGTTFAVNRLKEKKIFCISPPRINICGHINCILFDKTGTLTEEGLDVFGVQPSVYSTESNARFDHMETFASSLNQNPNYRQIVQALASCHMVKNIGGKFIGDPLDLKMFDFSGWLLEDDQLDLPDDPDAIDIVRSPVGLFGQYITPDLKIVKNFEFVPAMRRMAVVIKEKGPSSNPNPIVYVKGAPESIQLICRQETIPKNFSQILDGYSRDGYRVIALAHKYLSHENLRLETLSRDFAESDLAFIGFIIFENKLKNETVPTIKKLNDAKFRSIMCTGDNVLTAISVSRESGIVSSKSIVFTAVLEQDDNGSQTLVWKNNIDGNLTALDPITLSVQNSSAKIPFELAISGDTFDFLSEGGPEVFNRVLLKAQIFARMSPDQKKMLVEKLQALSFCVSFCGDGANDCGALKASDAGVSLSEAEASIAAPFTSKISNISCMLDVISEGRAALATSFSCFKFMSLYSMIQFVSCIFLYLCGKGLTDGQFVFIDLLIVLPLAILMSHFRSSFEIIPRRPVAKLISLEVLTSIIGQIIIMGAFQTGVYFATTTAEWYEFPGIDPDNVASASMEGSSLFYFSSLQYIIIAFVYCAGKPYRQRIYTNFPFVINLILSATLCFLVLSMDSSTWIGEYLDIMDVPSSHKYFIGYLAAINGAVSILADVYLWPLIISLLNTLLGNKGKAKQEKMQMLSNKTV